MSEPQNNIKTSLSKILIRWYDQNKRDLPWRDTSDPYKIWISEVILQQTRVTQGIDYYYKFLAKFPDVISLAQEHEDEVLKIWQGLGYYSRARNMRFAAGQIMNEFNGKFPDNYFDMRKLKGVGEYTASAICSIAFNLPYPVVDGNVMRVLSRFFGIAVPVDTTDGYKQISFFAAEILDNKQAGLQNQALMEFGALKCVPVSPACNTCPINENCFAYQNNLVKLLPVKSKKIQLKHRFFNYLLIKLGNDIFINKRADEDIWKNLYEFPLIETDKLLSKEELAETDIFQNLIKGIGLVEIKDNIFSARHVLTHQIINARLFTVNISNKNIQLENFIQIKEYEIQSYPVSRLVEKLFEKNIKQKNPVK